MSETGAKVRDFTDSRSIKFLKQFLQDIEEIIAEFQDSERSETDERVVVLQTRVEREKARSKQHRGREAESISYIPALDELELYLDNYTRAESDQQRFDALYDASISAGYWIADIESGA